MKSLLKAMRSIAVFGNPNRAHRAKVPLLIVALVAAVGFSMVSCRGRSGNAAGAGAESGGTLTVTGLSAHNGRYAKFGYSISQRNINGSPEDFYDSPGLLINNGRVVLPMWEHDVSTTQSTLEGWQRYTGNDTIPGGELIAIFDSDDVWKGTVAFVRLPTFTFSHGSATVVAE